jgi:hypothetical protein
VAAKNAFIFDDRKVASRFDKGGKREGWPAVRGPDSLAQESRILVRVYRCGPEVSGRVLLSRETFDLTRNMRW